MLQWSFTESGLYIKTVITDIFLPFCYHFEPVTPHNHAVHQMHLMVYLIHFAWLLHVSIWDNSIFTRGHLNALSLWKCDQIHKIIISWDYDPLSCNILQNPLSVYCVSTPILINPSYSDTPPGIPIITCYKSAPVYILWYAE